jgi:hypothetical protein
MQTEHGRAALGSSTAHGECKTVHENQRSHVCNICTKGFAQKKNVIRHECKICNKRFTERHELNSHAEAVHENRRDHVCNICTQRFSIERNFSLHIETVHGSSTVHGNQKSHDKFALKNIAALKQEQALEDYLNRLNENLRDHECNICNLKFSTKRYLNLHIKTVHAKIE